MKKHSKLLVLVLSLMLIIGAFAIFASADDTEVAQVGETKYMTLAEALEAVENDGTVTLIADAKLSATYAVFKNITIDLNGKTLDVETDTAFTMDAANTLKITGDGDIALAGTLIKNATKEIAYTFTIEGTDKGIDVAHKGAGNGVRIADVKSGTINFKNVSIVSTSTGEAADKVFFYSQNDAVGVAFNFDVFSLYNTGNPGAQNALGFLYLGGGSVANVKNSTVRSGGTPIHAEKNSSRDFNNVIVNVENSHLEIISKDNDLRSNLIWMGGSDANDANVKGTVYFKGSFLGGNCYRGVHGHKVSAQQANIVFDNSVMANNGANDSKGTGDNDTQFTRGASITFKNNSIIVSADAIGIAESGVINVEVGTRFTSLNAAKNTGFKWMDANGASVDKATINFVYDPAGNTKYPVLATTDSTAGISFVGNPKWDFAGMDHGSGRKSFSEHGFYVNNKSNDSIKADYSDFYQGQPKTGAVTKYSAQGSTAFKYWIPNVVTVNGSTGSSYANWSTKEVNYGEEFKVGSTEADAYFVFGDNAKYTSAFAPIADDADKIEPTFT